MSGLCGQRHIGCRAPPFDCEASHNGMASQQSKEEEMVEMAGWTVSVPVYMGLHLMLSVQQWEQTQTTALVW